jgi:hypothetical protein
MCAGIVFGWKSVIWVSSSYQHRCVPKLQHSLITRSGIIRSGKPIINPRPSDFGGTRKIERQQRFSGMHSHGIVEIAILEYVGRAEIKQGENFLGSTVCELLLPPCGLTI